MIHKIVLYLIVFVVACFCKILTKEETLQQALFSYLNETNIISDNETITVHIVAHTHLDPGYKVTADQYYFKNARFILDSLIPVLKANKDRKFTFVEQSFFQRWWNEQNQATKDSISEFIKNGRLEMNLGGWVMVDEATTEYEDVINQMTLGHKYIYDQFGVRPKVAWHVDPFGHSNQMASLYKDMGFDVFSFWRIFYEDMQERKKNQKLEFVWRGSKSQGKNSDIFGYCLDSGYYTPNEGNFFASTQGEVYYVTEDERWFQWDEELPTFKVNVKKHADEFSKMVHTRSTWYDNGRNLLIPWGGDFSFFLAFMPFDSMDKFIEYMNAHEDIYHIHMKYSTLSEYANDVHKYNKKWSVKTDDFFPLADGAYGYWTGFYSSRERLKGLIREKMNELSNAEMYFALSKSKNLDLNYNEIYKKILKLRKAQGEVQHHDAITGTCRQAVADDYVVQLTDASYFSNEATSDILNIFTTLENINKNSTEIFSKLSKTNSIVVILSNTLAWTRKEMIRILLPRSDIGVYDKNNNEIESQINEIPSFSYDRRNGTHYIYFVTDIPAMGYSSVYLKIKTNTVVTKPITSEYISNDKYKLYIQNGYITKVDLSNNKTHLLNSDLYQYISVDGDSMISNAYCFNPIEKDEYGIGSSSSSQEKEGKLRILNNIQKYENCGYLFTPRDSNNYKDIFVTLLQSQTSSSVNYYTKRIDGENWLQNLELSILPFSTLLNEKNLQSDSLSFTGQNTHSMTLTINFQTSFDTQQTIYMFSSIVSTSKTPLITSILSISSTQATVSVTNYNEDTCEGEHILQYIAFTKDTFPFSELDNQYVLDSISCSLTSNTNGFIQCPVKLSQRLIKPRVLIQSTSNISSAITVTDVHKDSFIINIFIDPKDTSYQNVDTMTFNFLAFSSRLQGDYVIPKTKPLETTIIKGALVEEIQQTYRDGYYTLYRVYKEGTQKNMIEINTEMNGVDNGAEVTLMLHTDINNEQTLYTDAMGMEQQERIFNFDNAQPIPSNYYPATSRVYIQDKVQNYRMTVLLDRAHGVSSTYNGNINIMLKRRTVDHKGEGGTGEPIDENDHVRVKYWMILDTIEESAAEYKQDDLLLNHYPIQFYATKESNIPVISDYSSMQSDLPPQIQLLNFQLVSTEDKTFILRLHHIYEKDESIQYSVPVDVDISKIFKEFEIVDYEEMILTGMFKKSEVDKERIHWMTEDETNDESMKETIKTQNGSIRGNKSFIITLQPMEFKTFQVVVK